ncbi:MAG: hypothetical protein AAB329_05485 [Pseudomonadota bacterium]
MYVEETFYRRDELMREARTLPAATYNLARTLLGRAPHGCLFVPIRSMQWLAVLDAEEIVFVDREAGRFIDIAWREFRPQARQSLDEPVAYLAVYYSREDAARMVRLQGEFPKALRELEHRQVTPPPGRVLRIEDHRVG